MVTETTGEITPTPENVPEALTERPTALFEHIFGETTEGHLVTFTGQQARLRRPDARQNELAGIRQRSFRYPGEAEQAASYLLAEADKQRDAYIGVHLFRDPNTRLAANAMRTVLSLWLDEDEGAYPEIGPHPTAVVASSARRRHLYWRLTQAVAVEWAVTMNRRLAVWAGGDCGKAGLASVLRVPGTQNYKRHPQVDPVTMEITDAEFWDPEVLEQAIPPLPEAQANKRPEEKPYDGPQLDLDLYLENIEVLGEVADSVGTKYAIVCPWISLHSGGDRTGTRIGQRENGALWFHCDHEHCQGRTWRDFKKKMLPGSFVGMKITRPGYTGSMEVKHG